LFYFIFLIDSNTLLSGAFSEVKIKKSKFHDASAKVQLPIISDITNSIVSMESSEIYNILYEYIFALF